MYESDSEEIQLTKLERVFMVGIIGCMLFATWELAHLIVDEWLRSWVKTNSFVNRRIIYYGIAFFMSITSVLITTKLAFKFGRFGKTIARAFLWYGTLLLISTIAIFVFDCLPEVFAGYIGAGVFVYAIYLLHKQYLTKERIMKSRLEQGKCFSCDSKLQDNSTHCSNCGVQVGRKCSQCSTLLRLIDNFCLSCGIKQEKK